MQPIIVEVVLAVALVAAIVALVIRSRATPSIGEIIEAAPDAILAVREDGTIRAANSRVTAIFGYEPSELVGRPVETLVPQQLRAHHPGLRRKFMDEGVGRRMGERIANLRGVRKDGTEVPVDISLSVVPFGGRRMVFAAVRDLTPTLKAQADEQERLRQIQEELRRVNFLSDSALDLTKAGYWYVDLDDTGYYEASDRVRDIFGEAPRSDRRYNLATEWHARIAAVDDEAGKRVTELFQGAIEGRYDQYDAEYPYKRPADGRVIWTRARAFVERDASGKATKLFGVQQDLTEQHQAELLRDSLTHMIVHDLRSPLSGILMSLELIGEAKGLDDKSKDILRRALSSAQQLTHMISTLLDVNKMEAGEMRLNPTAGDLRDAVNESLATLSGLVASRQIIVDADGPVPASFDREIIVRVVSNLVANAIKFTPKNGTVTLRVGSRRGGACVEVVDTGRGIPPEFHARIFEKFGQVEARQQKQHLGTGLGLAFCKLALQAHGGDIGVESVVGQGSTFWFVLR